MRLRWLSLCLLVPLFLAGCRKDPYEQPDVTPPPSGGKYGSYQDVVRQQNTVALNDTPAKAKGAEVWKVTLGDAPVKGDRNAPVTVVEFSDFQCPFCTRAGNTIKKVVKKYKGKARLFFKHYPLAFHKQAHLASQAAIAAQKQGKFWEYHDKLFANQKKLYRADLERYAKELKLDMKKFKAALDKKTYKARVDAELAQGGQVGVSGTPTVFVNGRRISSWQEKELTKEIDAALKRVKAYTQKGLKGDKLYTTLIKDGKLKSKAPAKRTEPAKRKDPPKRQNVAVGNSPSIGDDDAPVTIVEFSDFECPYCSRGASTAKKVKRAYGDKVRLVFKHYPLSFHHFAKDAAYASMAAHDQGKFWEYHDLLFANQKKLDRGSLMGYAKQLGLDLERFKQKLDAYDTKAHISDDMTQASRVGVKGTPAFFINGVFLSGAQPFSAFKELVDKELLKKGFKKKDLPEEPGENINTEGAPAKGPQDAPVTIVEFSDFQCPFCTRFANVSNDLARAYKDKIRIVFKQNPLSFHKQAHLASQASLAAHAQGKFWEYHDKLFANQKKLFRPDLERYAKELGLDMTKFKAALDNGTYKTQVDTDMAEGARVGVRGTPTFYINGRKGKGYTFEKIKEQIDPILLKKGYKKADLPKGPPPLDIPVGRAPTKGNPKAPVTIVEFSDFQCPFCTRAARSLDEFYKYYKKYVRIAFKQYPLNFHKQAHLASQAALAAHEQGKFWAYHDKLFANQRKLHRPDLERYAKELKLEMTRFKASLDSKIYKAQVDADMAQGSKVGVSGTPTLFINGRKAKGFSFEKLKEQIDPILLKHGVKKADLPKRPPKVIKIGNSPFKGNPKSPVKFVEFSDFQCPFCSRAAKVVERVAKAYGDKIHVVFKQYPLGFHKQAHLAAQASLAAHAQGKFWAYHDKLFANQRKLHRPDLERYAKELGLDMTKFKAALDSKKYKAQVDAEMANGAYVGVNGTPSFFLNNKLLRGYSFEKIKAQIDPLLLKQGYKKKDLPKLPPKVIKIGNAPFKGPKDAPVTVVEFSDFQCPFCTRAIATINKLRKAYKDKVRVVFKQYPLGFHKQAHLAAQAALAAHAQGKFWAYHDKLFANQKKLFRPDLERYAKELGLDMTKFKAALDKKTFKAQVDADMANGVSVGVSGTPTFFVNGRLINSPSFEAIKASVDAALKKKAAPAARKAAPAARKAAPVARKAAPAARKAAPILRKAAPTVREIIDAARKKKAAARKAPKKDDPSCKNSICKPPAKDSKGKH